MTSLQNRDPQQLAAHLRDRLNAEKGSWRGIAEAADVSYSWLQKFGDGRISNPTIGKLQRLYEHFYPGSEAA